MCYGLLLDVVVRFELEEELMMKQYLLEVNWTRRDTAVRQVLDSVRT